MATFVRAEVYTSAPFVIQRSIYNALADSDAVDVAVEVHKGAPTLTAPAMVIPVVGPISAGTIDFVAGHDRANDSIAGNTVRITVESDAGGAIDATSELIVYLIWLDQGQQTGQSIDHDNNT